MMLRGPFVHGILFPEELLYTEWFGVFASFVAVNTMVYVVLGVSKLLPVIRSNPFRRTPFARSETRSIYPEGVGPTNSSE